MMTSIAHLATATPSALPCRDSIGGHPFLPAGVEWPVCPKSGKRMVLFFQFDIRTEYGLAHATGSHLLAFMSPMVNEIDTFARANPNVPLTDAYWAKRESHFTILLFDPKIELVQHAEAEPHLVAHELTFVPTPVEEVSDPFLFIGGTPRWYQAPEQPPGFEFIAMLSENYPFAKQPDAPPQPDSFSRNDYCLFLGNACYLLASPTPARPDHVFVALQN